MRQVLERSAGSSLTGSFYRHLPPFLGGLVGYFDYETCTDRLLDRSPQRSEKRPGSIFGLYDTLIAVDHRRDISWVISSGRCPETLKPDKTRAYEKIQRVLEDVARSHDAPDARTGLEWSLNEPRHLFELAVRKVQKYIEAGDIYQANLSHSFSAKVHSEFDALTLYAQIRSSNPSPFSCFANFENLQILSTSPERLIQVDNARNVEARPIKGTIKRSKHPGEDAKLKSALASSEKERAENTMIVDLLRNDLSRVCSPGSIHVDQLCLLESFAGLHQLTSSIRGILDDKYTVFDLLGDVLPGGSITGAPKIRAAEIIEELEARPRGAFCGSLGFIGFDSACDFNILIRTIEIFDNEARLNVGAGITLLSQPAAEYDETILKAERILQGASLLEAVS